MRKGPRDPAVEREVNGNSYLPGWLMAAVWRLESVIHVSGFVEVCIVWCKLRTRKRVYIAVPAILEEHMADFSGGLSQAPVVYALCELRFSPILKMAEMVPDIQERLRASYEEFEEERVAGVKLDQSGQTS